MRRNKLTQKTATPDRSASGSLLLALGGFAVKRGVSTMNAQKRDVLVATRHALESEGSTMLCAKCGYKLEGHVSCYCEACEAALYADE